MNTPQQAVITTNREEPLTLFPYALIALVTVLQTSILVSDGMVIGVLRLVGYSAVRVWARIVGRLYLFSVVTGASAALAASLIIPDLSRKTILQLTLAVMTAAVMGMLVTALVGVITIRRIRLAELIKGRLS